MNTIARIIALFVLAFFIDHVTHGGIPEYIAAMLGLIYVNGVPAVPVRK